MAHGRLRKADRASEVAHARLAVGLRSDQAEETKSGWIRQNPEGTCESLGFNLAQGCGEDLRATLGIDDGDLTH